MELRRVVIVGGGKIGSTVAAYLLEDQKKPQGVVKRLVRLLGRERKRSVKLVERDYARCKQLSQDLPRALVINADISDEGVFEEEHFADSDLVIVATGDQELNIVTAVYAKTLGIKRSISLVNKTNYIRVASQLGVDVPVSVKNSMVNSILKQVRRGNIRSVHSIPEGDLEVMEISVDGSSEADGKRIEEIKLPQGALVVSVLRDEETFVPDGSFQVRGGDHVIVIARLESIERIQALFMAAE
jgi:trk system potassium uptake protein TrkA